MIPDENPNSGAGEALGRNANLIFRGKQRPTEEESDPPADVTSNGGGGGPKNWGKLCNAVNSGLLTVPQSIEVKKSDSKDEGKLGRHQSRC